VWFGVFFGGFLFLGVGGGEGGLGGGGVWGGEVLGGGGWGLWFGGRGLFWGKSPNRPFQADTNAIDTGKKLPKRTTYLKKEQVVLQGFLLCSFRRGGGPGGLY